MKRKKILVITGTRAEWGLLHPVVEEIRKSKHLTLRLLVTGIHTLPEYGNTISDIRESGVPIHCIVPVKKGQSMLSMLSEEIRGIEKYCLKERPDLMLVLGDRDEPFAGAIVAGHMRIPVAHIHGGDSTRYVVDDAIRHSISKFAHIHFPVSRVSEKRLLAMGEERSRIQFSGSTAFSSLKNMRLLSRDELAKKYALDVQQRWILVLQHPTPLDPVPVKHQIQETLTAVRTVRAQKIYIYPNTDSGSEVFIRELKAEKSNKDACVVPSLPRHLYLSLLKEVDVLVGNSSSGILEASYFGTPVVTVGDRQKGREYASHIIPTTYNNRLIGAAITKALSPQFKKKAKKARYAFGTGGAAKKICRILEKIPLNDALLDKTILVK